MHDQLLWERELLGLYLSQHPLEAFATLLSEQTIALNSLEPSHDGRNVVVGGLVTDIREITTKTGSKMAFVKIEDMGGEVELILFPSALQQTLGLWERDRIVVVRGKISAKDREGNIGSEVKVLADEAREVTHEQATAYQSTGRKVNVPKANPKAVAKQAAATANAQVTARLYIRLLSSEDQKLLVSLKQIIDEHHGDTEVVLVLGPENAKQIVRLPMHVRADQASMKSLRDLVGDQNVVLR
jgi:DNA polymerase-3 subunit alpha